MTTALYLLTGLFAAAQASTANVPPPQEQIAAAVLAAPEELRGGAGVLGYDQNGKLVTLRDGRNELVCLADSPGGARFSAACYHKDLEPYMARGRDLRAEGMSENNRRARFYSITRAGRKQLVAETESWARTVAMVKRMLETES